MPRDHARIQTAVWEDPEWCALDVPAQHAYWLLLSTRNLSWCGVLDWLPGRLRGKAKGLTVAKLTAAVSTLERKRFVVIDEETAELLVRSYVRHDRVMERPNMGKAVAYAWDQIVSPSLRDTVLIELARLHNQSPDLAGWKGFEARLPAVMKRVLVMASAMQSPMQSPMQSGMESPMQSDEPSDMESGMGWGDA